MSDLIDRQQVIDALRTCYDTETISMDNGDEYINYGDAVGEIEQLPSLQSEPHWIPVSERLPEINEGILLSYFDEITIGWLNNDGLWSIYDGWKCVNADEVSAWMPLPEPYKEVTT